MKHISALLILVTSIFGFAQNSNENTLENHSEIITQGPDKGTLLIVGGAASNYFYEEFMKLVGGENEPIVVIPTAGTSEVISQENLDSFKNSFIKKGFKNVTVLHTHNREEANTKEFIEVLKNAKGVWFSGGRQWRLADSYLNTKTHEAFKALLDRGGVIAGSSAGATIQGSYLARGDTKTNTIMMGDHEEGLNFLTNVAIDQHLLARNRQFDMFDILENRPELLGIGLDEDTGIIVRNNTFEVIGSSYVAIYDGTRWLKDKNEIIKLPKGSRDFYFLKKGDTYNLNERRIIRD
ncbi:cyanophycinase [Lutibacter sp.]|uniref:cyanophycinase n=1 Tax=Lutibacter sp. TaxID=1925666 RepID=UPI0034A025E2